MNPDTKVLTPAGKAEDPIEIGNKGYSLGAKFYLGLTYKRVKGKNRVRGIRKDYYSAAQLGRYTPAQWQSMTDEQRQLPNFIF
jgi:hypothetical protein